MEFPANKLICMMINNMPSCILQSTASECGLTCLAMIANHYGRQTNLFELRNTYTISLNGTSVADLIRISADLNLNSRAIRLEIEHLDKLKTPCILHWDLNHFVVLNKITNNKVYILDPAFGEKTLTLEETGKHFTGIALELSPSPEFKRKKSPSPLDWKEMVNKITGLKRSIVLLILFSMILQAIGMLIPFITQWLIDDVILSEDIDLLVVLAIGASFLYLTHTFISFIRSRIGIYISTQINIQWSHQVMNHLIHLPSKYYETRHTGDIISRFHSLDNIQATVTTILVESILDGLLAITTGIIIFIYSGFLSVIVFSCVLIYGLIRLISYSNLRKVMSESIELSAREQSYFIETIRGQQSIKIGVLEDQRRSRWFNLLIQATNKRVNSELLSLNYNTAYTALFGLEAVIVLFVGARCTIDGVMSTGMLLAFLAYKDQFSNKLQSLIDKLIDLHLLNLQVERLADIVITPKEKTSGVYPLELNNSPKLPPSVEFRNVSFKYGIGEKWIIHNLSLNITAGEHIAIIGASGCGKSTFAKLLLGLLEPSEGEILIDDVPLRQYGLANWRRNLGVVMQEDQLFSGSIRDNISGFSQEADMTQIQNAAKLAAIHDEITKMPMSYNTLNGDMGSSLSGGQKQRVLLARALYRQPGLLLLDEATSHLDVDLERVVNNAISNLPLTRIVIAHRPDTIKMAERIIDLTKLNINQPDHTLATTLK